MSHFVTVVLLPIESINLDSKEIERRVGNALAPFNENEEVDEYEEECYCKDWRIRAVASDEAEELVGMGINQLRENYWAIPEDKRPDWQDHIKIYTEALDIATEKAKETVGFDPECDECHGAGIRTSTYNPNSQWDWYVIGGRWHGGIKGKYREDLDQYNDNVEANTVTTEELLETDFIPFAVLTPDGEWIEKGKMGWWGMASNEKDENVWSEQFHTVLKKYPGHWAVACDLHI